jgi:uncharacterized membrane protein (DUF106 family)
MLQRYHGQLYPAEEEKPKNPKLLVKTAKDKTLSREKRNTKISVHIDEIKASMGELAQSGEQRMNHLQKEVGSLHNSIADMFAMFKIMFGALVMIICIYAYHYVTNRQEALTSSI